MKQKKHIVLGHGSGGTLTSELISSVFLKHFKSKELSKLNDAAITKVSSHQLSFTTDSYVVDPIIFPGGNIGKLAICGTVNDLAVSGARPKYLSTGFIIEEGLELQLLEEVVKTMADWAEIAGVEIVCGDTKIVQKGKCDKLYINTAGIGVFDADSFVSDRSRIRAGDNIIINGPVGDHGIAVLGARKKLNFRNSIESDCAPLNGLITSLKSVNHGIRFMRDVTRGGLATILSEIVSNGNIGIRVSEKDIPLNESVAEVCEILGFDPLYLANEGKLLLVVHADMAKETLKCLKEHPMGRESSIIGKVTSEQAGRIILQTAIGGQRYISEMSDILLPRIC